MQVLALPIKEAVFSRHPRPLWRTGDEMRFGLGKRCRLKLLERTLTLTIRSSWRRADLELGRERALG